MKEIYLDNNATTQMDKVVVQEMKPYFENLYGNPSSTYSFGSKIKKKIEESRQSIANLIHAKKEEIIFTSCASESNTTAILNAIRQNPQKKHIITSKVEHASIIECMHDLEESGYEITYLNVDELGRINRNELESSIKEDTCLIAIMLANNETGNIYPIQEIGKIAKEKQILFHCDAVQAAGKIEIDVNDLNVDTLSLSAHKIYGPKGIGALYIRNNTPFRPLIYGHQEQNRRGGTENVPYIIGFGIAAFQASQNFVEEYQHLFEMRNKLEELITSRITDVYIYGDIQNRLPNTCNIAFKNVNGEELMLLLESFQIYVSTGSACNATIALPSHVLVAMHVNLENSSPIRISLGKYNTMEEIKEFVVRLENAVATLRKKVVNK